MESNLADKNIPISPTNDVNTSGTDSPEQRISELTAALKVVKEKFISYRRKLKSQIWFWGLLCLSIIISCISFSNHLLNEVFPQNWTWQIGYTSIIRITIAGAVFSLASFCFKIFRSYIHINEQNSHSITVIESMANLVGAAKDEQQRNLIYAKLIDIIINFSGSGFLTSDDDFKGIATSGLDTIQKLINKKE